jgi:hypothetical protein
MHGPDPAPVAEPEPLPEPVDPPGSLFAMASPTAVTERLDAGLSPEPPWSQASLVALLEVAQQRPARSLLPLAGLCAAWLVFYALAAPVPVSGEVLPFWHGVTRLLPLHLLAFSALVVLTGLALAPMSETLRAPLYGLGGTALAILAGRQLHALSHAHAFRDHPVIQALFGSAAFAGFALALCALIPAGLACRARFPRARVGVVLLGVGAGAFAGLLLALAAARGPWETLIHLAAIARGTDAIPIQGDRIAVWIVGAWVALGLVGIWALVHASSFSRVPAIGSLVSVLGALLPASALVVQALHVAKFAEWREALGPVQVSLLFGAGWLLGAIGLGVSAGAVERWNALRPASAPRFGRI